MHICDIYCVIISLVYKNHSEQTTIRVTSNDYRFDCTPHVHTASYVPCFRASSFWLLVCFVTHCKQSKLEAKKALHTAIKNWRCGRPWEQHYTDTFFTDKNIQGQDTITLLTDWKNARQCSHSIVFRLSGGKVSATELVVCVLLLPWKQRMIG